MTAVGLLYSRRSLEHATGLGHPESPERLEAIWRHLKQVGLKEALTVLEPRPQDPAGFLCGASPMAALSEHRPLGADRLLSLLEGGYPLPSPARSVEIHLKALLEH